MAQNTLIFSGRRLPRASVKGVDGIYVINPGTLSRPWSVDAPNGLWRSFAEIDLGDEAEVVSFLADWGDVAASSDEPEGTPHTVGEWQELQKALKAVAFAWKPSDDNTRRLFVSHSDEALVFARFALRRSLAPKVTVEPDGALKCDSLGDYLYCSAAIMLRDKTPLRACDHCGNWFAAHHQRARYCRKACGVAHHRRQTEK